MLEVELPHRFTLREYQKPLWRHIVSENGTRAVVCAHRRAGKDAVCWNIVLAKAMERKGLYLYALPTYTQARKVIWEGIGKSGLSLFDHVPKELIAKKNDSEMKLELINGSLIRVVGADEYDRLVGTNPLGIVFSEYALMNPRAWDFLRPILAENGGWCIWISTPRGHNAFYEVLQTAKEQKWFWQVLTVDDTKAIGPEMIQEERASGMTEDLIQQEYYCSFEASIQGAYFSEQIKDMRSQGRIRELPFDKDILVETYWDLGMRDAMAVWFGQRRGDWLDLFDYEERTGEGLQFWASLLEKKAKERGFDYGTHYAPHDIVVREIGTGKSRLEVADSLGLVFDVVPRVEDKMDSIQKARMIFPRVRIDSRLTYPIEALTQYHKKYDEERKVFASKPEHDWTSHCADAFQTLAAAQQEEYPSDDEPSSESIYAGRLA